MSTAVPREDAFFLQFPIKVVKMIVSALGSTSSFIHYKQAFTFASPLLFIIVDSNTMFYSYISPAIFFKLLLAAASKSFRSVAAQNQPTAEEMSAIVAANTAPKPGYNAGGGSVFANFVDANKEGQFFLHLQGSDVFEKPLSGLVKRDFLYWCSDLTFSDAMNTGSGLIGYAGRCVGMPLGGLAEAAAAGNQIAYDGLTGKGKFSITLGVSAVYVEQTNVFEGQIHGNTDDYAIRYWDSGLETMPRIGWEGTDEGDASANAATSSSSTFGEFTWMSAEEAAELANMTTTEVTSGAFETVYSKTWIKEHNEEAATANPNPEAELVIVDEVKNNTGDSSGSTRKLASATNRVVSAVLRLFGI